jgi:hypothetical protein
VRTVTRRSTGPAIRNFYLASRGGGPVNFVSLGPTDRAFAFIASVTVSPRVIHRLRSGEPLRRALSFARPRFMQPSMRRGGAKASSLLRMCVAADALRQRFVATWQGRRHRAQVRRLRA